MKKIKLTTGKFAIVDNEDYLLLNRFNWAYIEFKTNGEKNYYATTQINKKTIYMQELIMPAKKGKYLAHINKNTLDNRKNNLQIISNNHRRHIGLKKQVGASIYRGVQRASKNTWRVVVARDKIKYFGGIFKIEDERKAALSYNKLAKKIYGKFAYQNIIN